MAKTKEPTLDFKNEKKKEEVLMFKKQVKDIKIYKVMKTFSRCQEVESEV